MKRNTLNGLSIETVRKRENWKQRTLYVISENGYTTSHCANITELCQWLEWRFNLPEIKAVTPMKRFNRILKLIEG